MVAEPGTSRHPLKPPKNIYLGYERQAKSRIENKESKSTVRHIELPFRKTSPIEGQHVPNHIARPDHAKALHHRDDFDTVLE
jgi:hypothetical protein